MYNIWFYERFKMARGCLEAEALKDVVMVMMLYRSSLRFGSTAKLTKLNQEVGSLLCYPRTGEPVILLNRSGNNEIASRSSLARVTYCIRGRSDVHERQGGSARWIIGLIDEAPIPNNVHDSVKDNPRNTGIFDWVTDARIDLSHDKFEIGKRCW